MKEFTPSANGEVKEVRDIGDMLVFTFVRGGGTLGKDKDSQHKCS